LAHKALIAIPKLRHVSEKVGVEKADVKNVGVKKAGE